ncbi:MAG TPA: dicarboxylate/amino acid:cation symporter [Gammaproteobacteria bacterium]
MSKSRGKQRMFAMLLIAATVLGIVFGWIGNLILSPEKAIGFASDLSIITDVFLRLIRLIIAPLIFATLVPAIAQMSGVSQLGRIGVRAMLWFIGASLVSLSIGILMANWLQPGAALSGTLSLPPAMAAGAGATAGAGLDFSLAGFIRQLIPNSIVEAMSGSDMLPVVVVSILIGTAAAALKEKVRGFVDVIAQLGAVMFKVTDYVMRLAPFAIFAALAGSICVHGVGIVATYARFVGGFYLSLGLLWLLLISALVLIIGRRGLRLVSGIRQAVVLAFATSSSEAALPRLLEELAAFGISQRVATFVVPLGYSFNLDGAMMFCTFAILFVAQAYGVHLPLGRQVTLFLLLMATTKGLAGVPRAAIAVIAATLQDFDLPEAGMALILAVDYFLDMGRSATNMLGNAVAAAVVAHWEGESSPAEPPLSVP